LDAGYVSDKVATIAQAFHYTLHVCPAAKVLRKHVGGRARRWVAERTHSWMNRFRRILIRWEKRCENYLAMLHMRFALITFGKIFACF
jgi:transposase